MPRSKVGVLIGQYNTEEDKRALEVASLHLELLSRSVDSHETITLNTKCTHMSGSSLLVITALSF